MRCRTIVSIRGLRSIVLLSMTLFLVLKTLYRSDFRYIGLIEKLLVPLEDPLLIGPISLLYAIDYDKDLCPRKGYILRSPDLYPINSYK